MVSLAAGCGLRLQNPPATSRRRSETSFSPQSEPSDYTVVVLPDTQYYAQDHPAILEAQVQWIIHQRAADQIALVLHEGDIVESDAPLQWSRAAAALHTLDGVVPYVLSTGNHDYLRAGRFISRRTSIDAYFPGSTRTTPKEWLHGTFEPEHIENSFTIMDAPDGPWLILSLEFGPRDAVLRWAGEIASRFSSTRAIVLTHAYLYSDNSRYDHLSRSDQLWNPHRYLDDTEAGEVNDGEEIWQKLIGKNSNISFVLCGHDLDDGVGRLESERSDGTKAEQILANYQTGAMGGGGYLRLMRFSPSGHRVAVRTYSPYLDKFKSDPDNEFTVAY